MRTICVVFPFLLILQTFSLYSAQNRTAVINERSLSIGLDDDTSKVKNGTSDEDNSTDTNTMPLDDVSKRVNANLTQKTGSSILQSISKITESTGISQFESKSVLEYIEKVASAVPLNDKGNFEFKSKNIALSINAITLVDLGHQSHKTFYLSLVQNDSYNDNFGVSIVMPFDAVIQSLTDEDKLDLSRISIVVHKDDVLFREKGGSENTSTTDIPRTAIEGVVISVSFPGISVEDLKENIVLTFPRHNTNGSLDCVFWKRDVIDSGNYTWDNEGCSVLEINQTFVKCGCNHLTSFALALVLDESTLDEINDSIGRWSIVGTSISATALSITILIYALFPAFRDNKRYIIVLNICVSLLVVNILTIANYLSSTYHLNHYNLLCVFQAMFLHFFILSSLMWITCDSLYAFLSLKDISMDSQEHAIRVFTLLSWCLPSILVLLTLGIPPLDNYSFLPSSKMCWIRRPAIYFALVVPFASLMLSNCIIFGRVLIYLRRSTMPRGKGSKPYIIMKQLKGSVTLISLLTFTWVLGIIGFGKAQVVMSYAFEAVHSLQGFFAFIFFCVLNPTVADVLGASLALTLRTDAASHTTKPSFNFKQSSSTTKDPIDNVRQSESNSAPDKKDSVV